MRKKTAEGNHDGSDTPGAPLAFPALAEWLGAPMPGWAYVGPVIRIEDFVAGGRYVVRAELPGIDPGKDVTVHVGNGLLTIRAERSEEETRPHRSEFRYGSFERIVRLRRGRGRRHGLLQQRPSRGERRPCRDKAAGRHITVRKGD